MNESEIKRILPRASRDTIALNADSVLPGAKSKSPLCHEPLAADKRKEKNPSRRSVRVTSFRTRLLDFDNLCPKFFIDALRYLEILFDDSEEYLALEVRQRKVDKKTQEKTLIEIT